ncbi:hypothetical protein EJB05_46006, partial [Eragrostis curvula]
MSMLIDCGKKPPHGFQCPPLHAAATAATTTTKKAGRHLKLGVASLAGVCCLPQIHSSAYEARILAIN